jgi:hypothetical protein
MLNYLSATVWRRIREWRYSSVILDHGTESLQVVSFSLRPSYLRG